MAEQRLDMGTTEDEQKRKETFRELHRVSGDGTPESLRVDFLSMGALGMHLPRCAQERMNTLIDEASADLNMASNHNKGSLLFIAVMFAGAVLPIGAGAIVLWLGGLIGWVYLSIKCRGYTNEAIRKHAFIDGMLWTGIEMKKELRKMEEHMNTDSTLMSEVRQVAEKVNKLVPKEKN